VMPALSLSLLSVFFAAAAAKRRDLENIMI
jgi:hypothetical protein